MKKIGIIGGGFTGTMTAVQLVEKATEAFEIFLINERETLNKGIAYNPYSLKHLLNVTTGKMSAYPHLPDHFLNWVMEREDFKMKDRTFIANSFLPRKLYGTYLCSIWENNLEAARLKQIRITLIDNFVVDLDTDGDRIVITLDNESIVEVNECVIATGNHVPGNPSIKNADFYSSKRYFQNPWKIESVINVEDSLPVLIMGNGLTMVDTVLGLLEHGFKGKIYSISPNGFNILPHRHGGLKYTKLTEELGDTPSLFDLVRLFNKHIKSVREYGVSSEPVIDSLRPYTQKIWQSFSDREKSIFMSRLRHLWGVARHRIPLHSHDKMQQLRIDRRLHIRSGRIIDLTETGQSVIAEYFDKKEGVSKKVEVSRVINCTGPDTNLMNRDKSFLKNCLLRGTLCQDNLKLGIRADTDSFQILDQEGIPHKNLYTIGSNLKGDLWESTAVNELRGQAERLAERISPKKVTVTADLGV